MDKPDYQKWHDWMAVRTVIEDVEIVQANNIGAGGKRIVGRHNASKIVKALEDAGCRISWPTHPATAETR